MANLITMTSEEDVKAVRLYIFDSVKREEVDEMVLLLQMFCQYNPDFSLDSFPALCATGVIAVDVVSNVSKEQATLDLIKFKDSKGMRSPRAIVQVAQMKVPGKLFKKEIVTDLWLATVADKAFISVSGMGDTDIIFYDVEGGIRLVK